MGQPDMPRLDPTFATAGSGSPALPREDRNGGTGRPVRRRQAPCRRPMLLREDGARDRHARSPALLSENGSTPLCTLSSSTGPTGNLTNPATTAALRWRNDRCRVRCGCRRLLTPVGTSHRTCEDGTARRSTAGLDGRAPSLHWRSHRSRGRHRLWGGKVRSSPAPRSWPRPAPATSDTARPPRARRTAAASVVAPARRRPPGGLASAHGPCARPSRAP